MQEGKLRIYFGYVAGVGKTYAMLAAAHEEKYNGVDLVVGYVEPHNRPDTTALITGLEQLSPKEITYRDRPFYEVDVDQVIKRNPQVVIIDELAHSNIIGSRNHKRFQDVEEILRAGIDVYTTLNVQHIESAFEQIEAITGVRVNERIPDYLFDNASQIELIDIDPAELIERLHKGKIYHQSQVQHSLDHFFTLKKLRALRGIALRKTADQVNHAALKNDSNYDGASAKEHILVCVSASLTTPGVIRSAAKLVMAFKGDFTALHVVTERDDYLTKAERKQLQANLRLADQLGAKIAVIYGENFSEQISEYAKVSQISKLVVGKSPDKRFFKGRTFINDVAQAVPNLGIYIIPMVNEQQPNRFFLKRRGKVDLHFDMSDLVKTLLMLVCCTVLGLFAEKVGFSFSNVIILYILGVQVNALVTKGRIFSFISSLLAVLCFNFFFTEPYFSLRAIDSSYPATFFVMLTAGLITSNLIKKIKAQVRLNSDRAHRTELLFQTNQALQIPESSSETLAVTANALISLLARDIVIYPVEDGIRQKEVYYPAGNTTYTLDTYQNLKESGVAEWVLYNNKRAGATTDTLSAAKFLYLSIRRKQAVFAIIGILMADTDPLDPFEKEVSLAILGEAALVLEKDTLRRQQQKVALEMEQEQLRSNLLRSISHDLRTPLTSISGNAKLMLDNSTRIGEASKQELLSFIYDDALWLTNLIENLLMITRLEGDVALNLQANNLDDVIRAAIKHVDPHLDEHVFNLTISEADLFVSMDPALIMQVIINLLNNAVKYTHQGSTIDLRVTASDKTVCLEVADNGPGISDQALAKLFDLFYTSTDSPDAARGLGIGLALCKTIITIHKGEIYAKHQIPSGTIIGFTLPRMEIKVNE